MAMLALRSVPAWLASIDADRVAGHVREKLVRPTVERRPSGFCGAVPQNLREDGNRSYSGVRATVARIRDLGLAKRLGYAMPYKIRELIRNMVSAGNPNGVAFLPVGGKNRGRPTEEAWLTERQALKVIAKNETIRARARQPIGRQRAG